MPSLLGGFGGVLLGLCSGVKLGVEDVEPGAGREDSWGFGGTAGFVICFAAKSRSGMAFISSAWVSSSRRLMSWALNWVKLALFSSQSRSAAWRHTPTCYHAEVHKLEINLNQGCNACFQRAGFWRDEKAEFSKTFKNIKLVILM